jgi:hypothetical protein
MDLYFGISQVCNSNHQMYGALCNIFLAETIIIRLLKKLCEFIKSLFLAVCMHFVDFSVEL